MKAKRKIAGRVWELDGVTIVVTIPIAWQRRGGRKVIIVPDGGDAWAPAKPRPDETLIRALARAHRWKRLIEEGTYRSAGEIAEAEGVTRSFVNRLLRLTLLSPDIVEAILDGSQPKGVQLEDLTRAMSSGWEEQSRLFNRPPPHELRADERPLRPASNSCPADADDEQRTATKQTPTADMYWTAKKRRFRIVLPRQQQTFGILQSVRA